MRNTESSIQSTLMIYCVYPTTSTKLMISPSFKAIAYSTVAQNCVKFNYYQLFIRLRRAREGECDYINHSTQIVKESIMRDFDKIFVVKKDRIGASTCH